MRYATSFDIEIGAPIAVQDLAGRRWAGVLSSRPGPFSVQLDTGPIGPISKVIDMSAEKPWEDAPRQMLEDELGKLAVMLATVQQDNAALAEVVAMQADALSAPQTKTVYVGNTGEWYERLVDLLELLLVRQVGQRRPLAIADEALRELTRHIMEAE